MMGLEFHDDIENCFAGGWSDGLPVIPPYGTLVDAMLEHLGWEAPEIVGSIEEQRIDIRAEHLAATAVMAGCKPEYGPLLRALSLCLVDPAFNLGPVEVTTGGVAALVIVSGPAVATYGFEHEANALGANNRANATVGRFAQMVRHFCGRGGGTMQTHGTIGHPGRITFCIAEHPGTRWGPFHTQFGVDAALPVVSIMSAEGPNSVNNHYAETGELVLETIKRVSNNPYSIELERCLLKEVAVSAKPMPLEYFNAEGNHVSAQFFEYMKPLAGELPEFVRLEKIFAK